jgi:peptidoglycan/LPS O-acetylase OafA/YrhL
MSPIDSSSDSRPRALDGLWTGAVLAVAAANVAFHTGATFRGLWGGVLGRLDVGFPILFLLVGFVAFRPYVVAAAHGLRRPRVRRVWLWALVALPSYWLVVAVSLATAPRDVGVSAADWLRFATLSQIYTEDWIKPGLNHTWAVATVAAFGLILPVLGPLTVGRRWRPARTAGSTLAVGVLLTAGWLAGMATGLLKVTAHTTWLPMYGAFFGAGMALATAHTALRTGAAPRQWQTLDDFGAAPISCGVVAIGLLAVASTPVAGPRELIPSVPELATRLALFLGIAVILVIAAAFGPGTRVKSTLASPPSSWLATVSYGLFLWHLVVLDAIHRLGNRPLFSGGLLETFLTTIAVGLVLAILGHYLLERPLRRLGAGWPAPRKDRDRQPERRNGEEARDLWSRSPMGVFDARQREPAGDD